MRLREAASWPVSQGVAKTPAASDIEAPASSLVTGEGEQALELWGEGKVQMPMFFCQPPGTRLCSAEVILP